MSEVERVPVGGDDRCGEAPIWDTWRTRLLWADINASVVYEYRPGDRDRAVLSRDLPVSGLAINNDARLVLAGATGLHLWTARGEYRTVVSEHEGQPLVFNDIIAGPTGRVYAGTLYWDDNGMQRPGRLYLIERDGTLRVVDEGIELSNGLGFSPDNRTLYYADSARRVIYAYDVDGASGNLSRKRLFVQVEGDEGIPDGLSADIEGYVWCAQWYGGQVVRYDPEGRVERRVPLPVRQVASLACGGSDLMDLYITTAGENWPSHLAPPGYDYAAGNFGGGLYKLRLDVPGKPEHLAALT
ncbi:MAG TPA: SMP-30/gluconolactonase/LRE family protein [Tepidisphaeraceae bacterium]|nr:SMP-30/gluconolactonase/LRE family protein [Tepidisphaeraceae bacterium]